MTATLTEVKPVPIPTATRREAAELLLAVASKRIRNFDLPTIASNHGLSLTELQTFLSRCGYPHPERLIAAAHAIHRGDEPPVASARPAPPATEPRAGREPYVTALVSTALFVDDTYQRELDQARVTRMAKDYDPALVGIIEVSQRPDGRYAILDGQHRWALLRDVHFDNDDTRPDPHLVCRVHTGLDVDQEAKLYHRLNTTRKQLTGWDRWKARRSSGDTTVAAIEHVATAAGFTISYRARRGYITATKACELVHTLGGPDLLAEVLDVIRTAWNDDPEGPTAGIVQGLGHILTAYPRDTFDVDRLVEALSGVVPRQINARAAAAREIHKGTLDKLTAHVLVEQYNQLRRAGQVPAFFAVVQPGSPNKGTQRAAEVERTAAIRQWAIDKGLVASERSKITAAIREQYALEQENTDA